MNDAATGLTAVERALLLGFARRAIMEFMRTGSTPAIEEADLTPALCEPRGCFVTLTQRGKLRGCIGNIAAREPLFRATINNAVGSAFRDTRFPSVKGDDIPDLEIEISVLTEPMPLEFGSPAELLPQLHPGVDGVVLRLEGRTATFLPQVWEKIPEPAEFMDQLTLKAGLPRSAWRSGDAVVLTYQVESFEEDPRGSVHDQERKAGEHGDDEAGD